MGPKARPPGIIKNQGDKAIKTGKAKREKWQGYREKELQLEGRREKKKEKAMVDLRAQYGPLNFQGKRE